MNTIIFLGGIPGSLKTTMSYKLASKYHIDKVISLDILKTIINRENIDDAYIKTTTYEAKNIENLSVVDGYIKHSKIINSYFMQYIKMFDKDKVIIVEGATITRDFVLNFKDYNTIYINFYVENIDILKNRYISKNRMRKSRWLKKIDDILSIGDYLYNQSENNIKTDDENLVLDELGGYIDESIFL